MIHSKGINLINYRQFKHFNSTNFWNDISIQPWDDIKEFYDPNDMWKKMERSIYKCLRQTYPIEE